VISRSIPETRAIQHITAAIDALIKNKNQSEEILHAIDHLKRARKSVNKETWNMWQRIGEREKYIQKHETGEQDV